jgi:hypothetical protein
MSRELFVCVTAGGGLHSVQFDAKRCVSQSYFALCGSEYNDVVTAEEGEAAAYERLRDPDYWSDFGKMPQIIRGNVDWDAVASEELMGGWENVCGEYQEFGCVDGSDWYLSLQGCGQHDDWRDAAVIEWLIPEAEARRLLSLWDEYHLKSPSHLSALIREVEDIFGKYLSMQDRQQVVEQYLRVVKGGVDDE